MKRTPRSSWGTPSSKRRRTNRGLSLLPVRRGSYGSGSPYTPSRRGTVKRVMLTQTPNSVKRAVGTAAAAGLGYVVGNTPGALWSGRKAWRYLGPRNKRMSIVSGYRGGRFRKPKKNKRSKMSQALQRGYHVTEETYGIVTDPHCCYIQHSTWNLNSMVRAITGCLFRKIIAKAGFPMNSRTQELPLFSQDNSDGFKLQYITRNPVDAGIQLAEYTIVNDQSLTDVIGSFTGLRDHLYQFIANQTSTEPYKLILFSSDRNVLDTNWRVASQLELQSEMVELFMSSQVKVQNRSAGDQAGVDERFDLDRVDIQPLKGYLYNHKHADPRVKNNHSFPNITTVNDLPISRMQRDGLQLIKATNLGTTIQFQEPPHPKYWANCERSSKVSLQPAEIKTMYISYSIKGYLPKLLLRVRAERFQTVNAVDVFSSALGRSQTLALEELIHTVTTNPITLQYEREYKCGATATTKNIGTFLTDYSNVAESNE